MKKKCIGSLLKFAALRLGISIVMVSTMVGCGGGSDDTAKKNYALDGPIAKALSSSDISSLNDSKEFATIAKTKMSELRRQRNTLVTEIYDGVSTEYNEPSEWSYWIEPIDPFISQSIVLGDAGKSLASLTTANGGRGLAFGVNLFDKFNSNQMTAFQPAFKRMITWLVDGSPKQSNPSNVKVAYAGIGVKASSSGFAKAGIATKTINCPTLAANCIADANLVVLGGDLAVNQISSEIVANLMASGKPILYMHTKSNWTSESGAAILSAMNLKFGSYGGNYWAKDKVSSNLNKSDLLAKYDRFKNISLIVDKIGNSDFTGQYDWLQCPEYAGKTDCGNYNLVKNEILNPLAELRDIISAYDISGDSIFNTEGTEVLRALILWANIERRNISYPLDKKKDFSKWLLGVYVDHLVSYVGIKNEAQKDLGSYATVLSKNLAVSSSEESIDVYIPSSSGYTSIGRFAVPGADFTIELVDAKDANVKLRINTQHPGSTRIWDANRYDRPIFLKSKDFPLVAGKSYGFSSPYGGTLQLVFTGATSGQYVRVRVKGVARHPYLDKTNLSDDGSNFNSGLLAKNADWIEMKLPYIEISSLSGLASKVINGNVYNGNLVQYLDDINQYLYKNPFGLAGFSLSGLSLNKSVLDKCEILGWDCTNATIHTPPKTIHINADKWAQCGQSCSGNPIDMSSGISPYGDGEIHEIGHNLQVPSLKIYDSISAEVSNEIFPSHKNWNLFKMGIKKSTATKAYKNVFAMMTAAQAESDPIISMKNKLWSDATYSAQGGERFTFYLQWMYYWSDKLAMPAIDKDFDKANRGWGIFTLMYLHQRIFDSATPAQWPMVKESLGYSRYATKPSPSGIDNMLIVLSKLTERDQRPTFDLWGLQYSKEASDQVSYFGFAVEPRFFYVNDSQQDYTRARRIDMASENPIYPAFP